MDEMYHGVVKSFNGTSGYGFVECADTHAQFGKDMFFMKTSCIGGVPQKGTQVSFSLQHGQKGVEATNVQLQACLESLDGEEGGGGGQAASYNDVDSTELAYTGTIKSYDPQNGYGFIECAETFAYYNKDIFVMRTQLNGRTPNKGERVSFRLSNGQKGVEACDVEFLVASKPRAQAPTVFTGSVKREAPVQKSRPMSQASPGSNRFVGVVKSFVDAKGWGMIECASTRNLYGKDMFFMRTSLQREMAVGPGTQVSFAVVQGQKGAEAGLIEPAGSGRQVSMPAAHMKMQTTRPSRAPAAAAPQAMEAGMDFESIRMIAKVIESPHFGSIKSYNAEKGWGHISCRSTERFLGKDVFFMRTSLVSGTASKGELVVFKVSIGKKGPQAENMEVLPQGTFATDESPEAVTLAGTLKSFNVEKGFGFIQGDALRELFKKDVFVHQNELNGVMPSMGEEVSFTVRISEAGGPEATNVATASGGGRNFVPSRGKGFGKRAAPY